MKKKRPRKFRASKEVRAIARERIGSPPAKKVIPNPKHKAEKHRKKVLPETDI